MELILRRTPPSREIAAVATLLRKDSKTNRASSFGGSADRGSHVILSASEISHDLSEKVYALRKPTLPGVCFALLAKTIIASSFGGVYPRLKRQSIKLSVGYHFTEPLGDYRGGENFNEVRHYIRHYAFKQNNA